MHGKAHQKIINLSGKCRFHLRCDVQLVTHLFISMNSNFEKVARVCQLSEFINDIQLQDLGCQSKYFHIGETSFNKKQKRRQTMIECIPFW